MDLITYGDDLVYWLSAKEIPPCSHKPGEVWKDGCCSQRRGRLVRFRLALLLTMTVHQSRDRDQVQWV